MKIQYILTILSLEFLEDKAVYGTEYVSNGTFGTTGTIQWSAGGGWSYVQSTCVMDFPGVVFQLNEAYLFLHMNTVFRNYVDWASGTVLQTGSQCVLVNAMDVMSDSFKYEHQFQYRPDAVDELSGSCYIFNSEASATKFAAGFNCGINQTSTTSSSTTVLTTTVSSTSIAVPATTIPTSSTFSTVPTTTVSASSTSTAVPTTIVSASSTSTAVPATTVSTSSTPTTVSTTDVSASTVPPNTAAFAGWLQEVAEMSNLIVTSTPMFVHQALNVLTCGRLCLRNISCMSMFITRSGNSVRCDGHSVIYTNGVTSNETSYYIVV